MKKLLLLPLLFLAMTLISQKNDFKIEIDVDEMTGDTTIGTSVFRFSTKINSTVGLDIRLATAQGITYLCAIFYTDRLLSIDTEDKLMIKLANGEIITGQSLTRKISQYESSAGLYSTVIIYDMPPDSYQLLATNEIVMIRAESSKVNLDIYPGSKKSPSVCMANFSQYYSAVIID